VESRRDRLRGSCVKRAFGEASAALAAEARMLDVDDEVARQEAII